MHLASEGTSKVRERTKREAKGVRPKRVVLSSASIFRGIQNETKRATEEVVRDLPAGRKEAEREKIAGLFREALGLLAQNVRLMRYQEIPTYSTDPGLEERAEELEEYVQQLQEQLKAKRSSFLRKYEERLSRAAKQATSESRVVEVGIPKAEPITRESIALGLFGEPGVTKMQKRKERVREVLTRLRKQGERVNRRMSNVQRVLQMIEQSKPQEPVDKLLMVDQHQ